VSYRRVLIVEDDESLCRVLKRNLAARDIESVCADSVAVALHLVATDRPDLLVLDINLPDRSGWELCRALRAREIEIPKVIVSATRITPERLAEFKPLAFLPKPFPLEALLRIVVQSDAGIHAAAH
jgi:DNA-binding response OmpR family regulator